MMHPRRFRKMHKIEKARRCEYQSQKLKTKFDIQSAIVPSISYLIVDGIFSIKGHVTDKKMVAISQEVEEIKDYYKEKLCN